jgi:hypothetical protein
VNSVEEDNAVEDIIERDFSTFGITVLAGFDQPFGLTQGRSVNENDVPFGRVVKRSLGV